MIVISVVHLRQVAAFICVATVLIGLCILKAPRQTSLSLVSQLSERSLSLPLSVMADAEEDQHKSPILSADNAMRYGQVPCSPPHCKFECYRPPPGVVLNCSAPEFDWIQDWEPRECLTPNGKPFKIYPISFATPESEIVPCVPQKVKDFSTILPGVKRTYIFSARDEAEYKRDYRMAHFGYTKKKAGWDCNRHYEILAAGSVPYFLDLEQAPPHVMTSLPKDLLLAAKHLPGVQKTKIDHKAFNEVVYYEIACKLLEYTRSYLTTEKLAEYVLKASGNEGARRVLYLSARQQADNLRCQLLHGLRMLMDKKGGLLVDYPKIDHMYISPQNQPIMKPIDAQLFSYGFSYAYRLEDDPRIDRDLLDQRIKSQEFDVIIYGAVHRGTPYLELVLQHYPKEKVIFIDGEDWYDWDKVRAFQPKSIWGSGHFFMRELPEGCPWDRRSS